MIMIQLTGLSGAGKTTIARNVKIKFQQIDIRVDVIDGDEYRKTLCSDLGFSKSDRYENMRRLGTVSNELIKKGIITIIAAVNPYDIIRRELKINYNAKLVYVKCHLESMIKRDTKGLYKKSFLPDEHPDKIFNLTGIDDPFDVPKEADLIIETDLENIEESTNKLYLYICSQLP